MIRNGDPLVSRRLGLENDVAADLMHDAVIPALAESMRQ